MNPEIKKQGTKEKTGDKKSQVGVVVYLKDEKVEILASDIRRRTAAHLIRKSKQQYHPLKFFAVPSDEAKTVVQHVNDSHAADQNSS